MNKIKAIGLVVLLCLSAVVTVKAIDTIAPPPIPSDYQGCVYVDGKLAPDGTIVYATINGEDGTYKSKSVKTKGGYYKLLVVAPTDASYVGRIVNFHVQPPNKEDKVCGTILFKGGQVNVTMNLNYVSEDKEDKEEQNKNKPISNTISAETEIEHPLKINMERTIQLRYSGDTDTINITVKNNANRDVRGLWRIEICRKNADTWTMFDGKGISISVEGDSNTFETTYLGEGIYTSPIITFKAKSTSVWQFHIGTDLLLTPGTYKFNIEIVS